MKALPGTRHSPRPHRAMSPRLQPVLGGLSRRLPGRVPVLAWSRQAAPRTGRSGDRGDGHSGAPRRLPGRLSSSPALCVRQSVTLANEIIILAKLS